MIDLSDSRFIISSLSDRYGRRLGLAVPILGNDNGSDMHIHTDDDNDNGRIITMTMMMPLIGQGISYILMAAIVIFDLPLWTFYLAEFICGGCGSTVAVAAAYLTDATGQLCSSPCFCC